MRAGGGERGWVGSGAGQTTEVPLHLRTEGDDGGLKVDEGVAVAVREAHATNSGLVSHELWGWSTEGCRAPEG